MSVSFHKKVKRKIKYFLYSHFHWYKGKYVAFRLQGGLCNKLHCLFSACDIALHEKCFLIEPYLGWEKEIPFSEIYDLDHFNRVMNEFTGVKEFMISREKLNEPSVKKNSIDNAVNLWEYSEKGLIKQRNSACIDKTSTKLKVLEALRMKPEFEKIVESFDTDNFTAIQVRTESDWVKHAINERAHENEKILVTLPEILSMLKDFNCTGNIFFTSGQNHGKITESFKREGFNPVYFYNPQLEYEMNAAINWEICCRAETFIGLSRSTYSNLISLKRSIIIDNDQSYIYNYKNKILRRVDKGIQIVGEASVKKETKIF